jgi:hypothetical protein
MQPILDHLDNIVRPAIRDYFAAEEALDAANAKGDAQAVANARFDVIRKARTATVELNHLTDFVLHNQTPPMAFADLTAIRTAIRSTCVFGRGTTAVNDIDLLRDAADALKHAVLNRSTSPKKCSRRRRPRDTEAIRTRWPESPPDRRGRACPRRSPFVRAP